MKDEEGKSYVIEVNGNPGTKIIDIIGHNYFNDLIDFLSKRVKQITQTVNAKDAQTSIPSYYSTSNYSQCNEIISAVNIYAMTYRQFITLQKDGWVMSHN